VISNLGPSDALIRIPMKDFSEAMARVKTGEASKIWEYPKGTK